MWWVLLYLLTDKTEPLARLKDLHKVTGLQAGELEFSLRSDLRTRSRLLLFLRREGKTKTQIHESFVVSQGGP